MFDNHDVLLHNVRYLPEHKRILFSVSMFDDLDYGTKIDHGVLKLSL